MTDQEISTLLLFFKALANENRLKILGLLAQRECGVDELATLLQLKAPTISHHLSKLKDIGLVTMRTSGNDHLYRLDVNSLNNMSKDVFQSITSEKVVSLVTEIEFESWERKVLENFLEGDKLKVLPASYKKRLVIYKWLINFFDEDTKYTEKEINEILQKYYPDSASIRRAFIENRMMEREGGGGRYWRIPWEMPSLKS
jgi:DNA-binding transcriptional ArsR family regulator